jgi:hypothetical protein
MADRSVSIIISARDQASAVLRSFSGSLGLLASAAAVAVSAIAGVGAVLAKAAAAAAEQQQADLRLAAGLASVGENTAAARARFSEFSVAMMDATGVADEQIETMVALLAQVGRLSGEGLTRATKAALDFAAATGTSAEGAALLFAKAAQGSTAALSRYGIVVDEAGSKSEKFDAVLRKIESTMGGVSQQLGRSFSVNLQRVKNNLGEVFEEIGRGVIESEAFNRMLEGLAGSLKDLEKFFKDNPQLVEELAKGFAEAGGIIAEVSVKVARGILGMTGAMAGLKELLKGNVEGMNDVLDKFNAADMPLKILDDDIDALIERLAATPASAKRSGDAIAEAFGNAGTNVKTVLDMLSEGAKGLGLPDIKQLREQSEALGRFATDITAALGAGEISGDEFGAIALQVQELNEQLAEFGLNISLPFDVVTTKAKEILDLTKEMTDEFQTGVAGAAASFGDAMVGAAFGAKISFQELFRQIMIDLARAIVRALIFKSVLLAFQIGSAGATGGASGVISSAQHGGVVRGGRRGFDSVAALLTPGEVILPQDVAEDFRAIAKEARLARAAGSSGRVSGGGASLVANIRVEPVPSERVLAEFIEGINELTERKGFRLVATEVRG